MNGFSCLDFCHAQPCFLCSHAQAKTLTFSPKDKKLMNVFCRFPSSLSAFSVLSLLSCFLSYVLCSLSLSSSSFSSLISSSFFFFFCLQLSQLLMLLPTNHHNNFVSNEPTSVLHMRRSPSPPTSASTLSSSFNGGGGTTTTSLLHETSPVGPDTAPACGSSKDEWACELQSIPSSGLETVTGSGGGRCGELGLEDWETMLSETATSPGQDQSFLRWISLEFDGNAGLGIVDQGSDFDHIGGSSVSDSECRDEGRNRRRRGRSKKKRENGKETEERDGKGRSRGC